MPEARPPQSAPLLAFPADLLEWARAYVAAGVSVIPIYGDMNREKRKKAPDWRVLPREFDTAEQREKTVWKPYQSRFATDAEMVQWFDSDLVRSGRIPRGIAIVGGIVSGHLEILDFDQVGLYEQWVQTCHDHDVGDVLESLPLVVTPSGGRHLYYRCEETVGGNVKLAMEPVEVPEGTDPKKTKGLTKIGDRLCRLETRIETRGEGGYVVAPPSPAQCHPDDEAYILARGDLTRIPVISAAQRDAFHRMAHLYNLYVEPKRIVGRSEPRAAGAGLRPGEDYNQRGDYEQLLEDEGWRRVGHHGDKTLWCRPGKTGRHISATSNYAGSGLFFAFSTNAFPFESLRSYTPFGVYAALKHEGDFKAAARELGRKGFGEQRPPRRDPPPSTDADPAQAPPSSPLPSSSPAGEEALGHEEPPAEAAATPARPPSAYYATDTANARRFVKQHRDNIRFDHSLGEWYVWDGRRWALDETNRTQEMAKQTAINIFREAADCRDDIQRIELAKHAKKSLDAARLKAMVNLASSDPEVAGTHSDWDQDGNLFNLGNGTLNLVTGELQPHRREDLITHMVAIDFDKNAKCPVWTGCLQAWQPSEAVRVFLQRALGYTLTGETKEHFVFYKYGTGGNGKSIFTEVVKMIMGDYGYKSNRETFMHHQHGKNSGSASPEVMSMIGKRFVSVAEVQQGDRLNEAFVKDLSGGDTLAARALYSGEINFKPQCKLWMFGNHKPRIADDTTSIWRRFLIIPFTVKFEKKAEEDGQEDLRQPSAQANQPTQQPTDEPEAKKADLDLFDKLRAELPGILNWMVKGCLEWRRSGLQPPIEVRNASKDHQNGEDVVGAFIEDCCYVGPNAQATAGELYKAYEKWCDDMGEYKKSNRFFGASLGQRGLENVKSHGIRKWRGIGLLTESERNYLEEQKQDAGGAGGGLEAARWKSPQLNSHVEDFPPKPALSDPHDPRKTMPPVTAPLFTETETESLPDSSSKGWMKI